MYPILLAVSFHVYNTGIENASNPLRFISPMFLRDVPKKRISLSMILDDREVMYLYL